MHGSPHASFSVGSSDTLLPDSGSDVLPTHYTAQVMWGLGVTRRANGILAALFGADELRAYPVAADADTIAALRAHALRFWCDHVLTRTAPAPVNPFSQAPAAAPAPVPSPAAAPSVPAAAQLPVRTDRKSVV